ncbi:hypothetical protein D3C75_724440 [compost metagenome]
MVKEPLCKILMLLQHIIRPQVVILTAAKPGAAGTVITMQVNETELTKARIGITFLGIPGHERPADNGASPGFGNRIRKMQQQIITVLIFKLCCGGPKIIKICAEHVEFRHQCS